MRILLVKTSSLGDVIHNLPVVSDLLRTFPDAEIDWCVEESFAEIPRLHPGVREIFPVAIRRWRKVLAQRSTWQEISAFRKKLGHVQYDIVLDSQGLLKSGLIAWQARGVRCGYAAEAAREPWAARFYDFTFVIPRNIHAVERNRWLAAAALDYPVDLPLAYGIVAPDLAVSGLPEGRYAVLFSATSRDDKLWPEENWVALAQALMQRGLTPLLPGGSPLERARAERIAARVPGARLAPPLNLREMAGLIGRAALVVGVDTGLAHLAAALSVPVIALYITTDPALTGVYGPGFVRNLGAAGQSPGVDEVLRAVDQALRR
jgi:heptosyltransferase-1